jgi:myo-inositol-1(or 4)-monophosphatase
MDERVPREQLADVAERAARAGGSYLAESFRDGPVRGEYGTDDVKAEADRAAEERVVDVLSTTFPDHAVHAEEAGRSDGRGDGARYEWVVDPLDGTNNFASGVPLFATAVAVRDGEETLAAVVYEPLTDTCHRAIRGQGTTVDGEEPKRGEPLALSRATVSFVRGLDAVRDPEHKQRGDRMAASLEAATKRVLRTWAPTVDYALVASGYVEGLVALRPDAFERHAGELLLSEAGAATHRARGRYVAAADESTLAALEACLESRGDGGRV